MGSTVKRGRAKTPSVRQDAGIYPFLFEESSAAAIILRPDSTIQDVNRRLALLLECRKSELVGLRLTSLVHPAQRAALRAKLRAAFAGKGFEAMDVDLLGSNGCRVLMLLGGRVPTWTEGRSRRLMLSAADVTGRQLAHRRMAQSYRLLEGVVERSVDALALVSQERFRLVNQSMATLTGYRSEQLVGRSLLDIVPAELHDQTLKRHRRRVRGLSAVSRFETQLVKRDGQRVEVEVTATLVPLEEGIGTLLIYRDISDRRDREFQRDQSIERMGQLLDNSPLIVIRRRGDPREPLEYVSSNVSMLGYSQQEMLSGRVTWHSIIVPQDAQRVLDALESHDWSAQPALRHEYRVVCKGGAVRWLEERTIALADGPGKPALFQGIVTDVTERRQSERALRQAHSRLLTVREQERKRLASDLHDSVCQSIVAFSLELQAMLPDCRQCAGGGRLGRIADRCQSVVEEIRDICHGLYPNTLEALGIVPALRQLTDECPADMMVRCHLDRVLESHRPDPQIELALYRIAQEALGNAMSHSNAAEIRLSLRARKGRVMLVIEDDGQGFDATPNGGLGLHSMNERAKQCGGLLHIVSRPGRTRIEALLPMRHNQTVKKNGRDQA